MTTIAKLQLYADALRKWKDRGGIDGKGGDWNSQLREHKRKDEPTRAEFNIEPQFNKLTDQIRKDVLKCNP